ncbi:ankyrin, partial [Morchella conica CCBAS932]
MKNKLGSLLLDAAKKGHAMAISNLLAVGASVNFTKSGSESATIHLAASEGHDSAAIVLLGGGAKIELKNVFDLTPLYCAAGAGRLGMMKLLPSHGAWRAEEGLSLEEFAAGSGHIDVIRWLLHEVDPDTRERLFDIYNREVAIDMALLEGYNDIVAELLIPHLDFWEEDRWGFNTFCFAAIGGNESTIKKLLDLRRTNATVVAKTYFPDRTGSTPLHLAVGKNNHKLVGVIVLYNAEVDAVHNNGETPLHHAARGGSIDSVKQLLSG